jgi:hypothetical protein
VSVLHIRYVPYFGDDDTTGVDVSAYDLVPGELEPEVNCEVQEVTLMHMIDRHKASHAHSAGSPYASRHSNISLDSTAGASTSSTSSSSSHRGVIGVGSGSGSGSGSGQPSGTLMPGMKSEVLTALQEAMDLSSNQILKAYEKVKEGATQRARYITVRYICLCKYL